MNFTCKYCGSHSTITDPDKCDGWNHFYMNNTDRGPSGLSFEVIRCPNMDCQKMTLSVDLANSYNSRGNMVTSITQQHWDLLPESEAKILPDYIPQAVKKTYLQACRIKNLSPEASATLSRRCLQGMIRDFWKISLPTLKQEIDGLESLVDVETWESIDAVRSVGNIGAHMERDIDVIIEVDPDEAQLLIGLVESLIDDWYVDRYNRQQRNQKIRAVADAKAEEKKAKIQEEIA